MAREILTIRKRTYVKVTKAADPPPPVDTGVVRIISGGQTGADRAALDWAIANGIAHGGWCPAGRRAENGMIPTNYQLKETSSHDYTLRTRLNVRDSDATLIISQAPKLAGGSLFTRQIAMEMGKPWLHLHRGLDAPSTLSAFLAMHRVKVLNIAGPRASKESGIKAFAIQTLNECRTVLQGNLQSLTPAQAKHKEGKETEAGLG